MLDRVTAGLDLPRAIDASLPEGVLATARGKFVFLQNFSGSAQTVTFPGKMKDMLRGCVV